MTDKISVSAKPSRSAIRRTAALDWESARIFLEVARGGSIRTAAEALEISVNSTRRSLEKLERRLSTPLLTRHIDGVRVTAEGERVLKAAEQMERASFDLIRAPEHDGNSGELTLTATEGLGVYWIAPRILEFQRSHPELLIDLRCTMQTVDVLRLESDIAIQLRRPNELDLKIAKIGRLHAIPFASQSYIDRHGVPKTEADLANHRFVLQVADQVASARDYEGYFRGGQQQGQVPLRTDVSTAHYQAIAHGAGIGMLPTYAQAVGAQVVPLDYDFRTEQDIWLVYHPDAKRITRVKLVIDWLVEAFSSAHFPWFADKFIHPREFPVVQAVEKSAAM
jgi:DNA-binding transcriptional LysR family regulator